MKIVLNDGSEVDGMIGRFQNTIELTIPKSDAVAMLPKFMDADVMSTIKYYFGAWIYSYTGFTRFSSLDNPRVDEMRVWMEGKEEDIRVEKFPRFDEPYMPKGE